MSKNKLEELRENALTSFWEKIEMAGVAPTSDRGQTIQNEVADNSVPPLSDTLLKLATEPWKKCNSDYLMHSAVWREDLMNEVTAIDVLALAVIEFVKDEIEEDITRKLQEEEEAKDEEDEEE